MSGMRENLARALADAAGVRPAFDDPRTTDDNGINIITGREQGFKLADAALKSISAPTPLMVALLRQILFAQTDAVAIDVYKQIMNALREGK